MRSFLFRANSLAAAPFIAALLSLSLPGLGRAGDADVVSAVAECTAAGVCRFDVTLRHDDAGWEHYADRWEVLGEDGKLLATRVLRHPHVDEQPFTRSLGDVAVPKGVERVRIRAHDSVHGNGGAEIVIEIQRGA